MLLLDVDSKKNEFEKLSIKFKELKSLAINYKDAKELVNFSQNLRINPVGVFVNHEINDLKDIISSLSLKYIQLHGNESDEYIKKLKENNKITRLLKNKTVIKTIYVSGKIINFVTN